MKRHLDLARLASVLLLGVVALLLGGCAANEPENMSQRPWNSPKSWESGVPGMLYDRR